MKQWQIEQQEKIRAQMTARAMHEGELFAVANPPMVMLPKATHIAVRRALRIAVHAPVRYTFPDGTTEIKLERIA